MKSKLLLALFCFIANLSFCKKPKDGIYIYDVAYAEWNGISMGSKVLVKIMGDSIYIIHNGGNMSGQKGEIIDKGLIMKHKKTGKFIITHQKEDINATEIGGCSDGPSIIDFRKKKFWLC